MKKVDNSKGFLVLEVSRPELMKAFGDNTKGICDSCASVPTKGYYIAALNQWFCPKCYEEWLSQATRYVADIPIEERRFRFYEVLFRKASQELC